MQIPLLDLNRQYKEIKPEIDEALLQAVTDASYILGPPVKQLENELVSYLDSKHTHGVASGTDALILSLRALAIYKKGTEYFTALDEIITTPFTFTATGGSILRSGATPVFVDIDPATYNFDTDKVKAAVTPNTVGIIPVHLYGLSCPMDEIKDIADQHDLFILEDVAQAFGATYNGQKLGTIGDLGAYSFFPSKNLGAFGDGGLVSTDHDELAELIRMLHKHGGKDKYNVDYIGYNSRLDTIQAAILSVKLKHVDRLNKLRQDIAAYYFEHLQDLPWMELPAVNDPEHVYHQFTVRIKNGKRDLVQEQLKNQGIATAVYYPVPLHQMKVFKDRYHVPEPLSNAEQACSEVLSLPVEPLLTAAEKEYIVNTIKSLKV